MAKLFVFGIGGTGSRVLRSLTMLLASGVEINADEIVPIIIDPDHSAADLTRTVELMRRYKEIRDNINFDTTQSNKFFKTKINLDIVPSVVMPIDRTQNMKFEEFIGYDGLSKANKALASMLFSKRNLNANMEVGFKGNPNIGSVVLNQFQSSRIFENVVSAFGQDDRIFVISSIFGGTGASGFPLLVKNLRTANFKLQNSGYVKKAPIGAITVLPYFGLKPVDIEKSEIDSSSFISKAKAALQYYERNLNEVNVLYYLADAISKQYDNVEGGIEQKNDAHIVEMIAALSMIDFMNIDDQNMSVDALGNSTNAIYKEFGIKEGTKEVIFDNLHDKTKNIIKKPLVQFTLFCKYIMEQVNESRQKHTWATDLEFDDNFFKSDFYVKTKGFVELMYRWLEELANNERSFSPFELVENKKELFSFVKGVVPAKVMRIDRNYDLFDHYVNDQARALKTAKGKSKNHNFIELFYKSTEIILDKKLNIK